ncbi:MAG: LPXTG cell wall anchor domain-containing protein [Apilactobacillus waqarii]|uniref:LPXTG cell wall anchor domain-containing protein n=1 Tax=Apilactobacillus waqarii TaxID=2851006 RepID=UPI003F3B249E
MKFNKKDSKLFKNTKKFVYVSAITGVLLTGTQAGQFASTYTAHADESSQAQYSARVDFKDQNGDDIAAYNLSSSSPQYDITGILSQLNVTSNQKYVDISKGDSTVTADAPTHTLHAEIVDQNHNKVFEKDYTVTDYSQFLNDLASHVPSGYGYDTTGLNVSASQTSFTLPVQAPTTTVVNQSTQQNNTTTETTTQSSSTTTVQSSASDQNVKSSAQSSSADQSSASNDDKKESASSVSTSEATKPVAQSSETTKQSSSATETVKSEAASSAVSSSAATSTESSAQSSNSSSSASQAPKSDEKTMVIVDPVNKGEHKKAQQTPAADKKDVRAKLPQTGDNTNQARAIALGVATIAVGLGLAYLGLRRKNK